MIDVETLKNTNKDLSKQKVEKFFVIEQLWKENEEMQSKLINSNAVMLFAENRSEIL